jgi:hypothetical protein
VRSRLVLVITILFLLAGCAMPGKHTGTPLPSSTPQPTAGATPTLSPTPVIPLIVLVIPPDMPQKESDLYQATFYDLAEKNSMRFQVLNTLTMSDLQLIGPALKIAVVFPPDPGLAQLAAAAPQAQFLAVGIPGLASAPNLSTIGVERSSDKQAFMAGYIAAMLSLDYRIGIITRDDPGGQAALTAFTNGMHFFCGLCRPAFPPWYDYPVHPIIPPSELESQYPGYVIPLKSYVADYAYVYPEVATFELLDAMAQHGLWIIGERLPTEDLRTSWVVSIQPDLMSGILKIFPDLLAGHGGQNYATPLYLTDIHTGLISEGKLRLIKETLADLQAGFIDTGVK